MVERASSQGRAARCVFALVLAACGDEEGAATPEVDQEGLAMCCELGAACHPDEADPLGSQKQACHATGHENEPAKCREQYDDCMELCAGEGMEEPHGCR